MLASTPASRHQCSPMFLLPASAGCSISAHAALCEVAPGTKIVLRAKATEPGSWINTVKVVAGSSSAVDTITVTVFRSTCGDVTFGPPKDRFTGCPAEFPYDPNNADKFPPGIDTCCVSDGPVHRCSPCFSVCKAVSFTPATSCSATTHVGASCIRQSVPLKLFVTDI